MYYVAENIELVPGWSAGADRRLAFSMLCGTVVVAVSISWLRLPGVADWQPVTALVIDVILDRPAAPEQIEAPPDPVPLPMDEPATMPETELPMAPVETGNAAVEPDRAADPAPRPDWQSLAAIAVQNFVESDRDASVMNRAFEEKRRAAATRFRPSQAPVKKPIWENVEVDALGRTLLRSGDCYKVLDNPTVTNRWYARTFEQFMMFCGGSEKDYLIEFDEIPDRYADLVPVED